MKKKEETLDVNNINDNFDMPLEAVEKQEPIITDKPKKVRKVEEEDTIVPNCLRKEKVIVRFIPKKSGIWGDNPKHVLAGGMAETAKKVFTVPRLASGMYVNVLTDNEKAYLEEIMGLEYNALSVYKKVDNFWDDSNEGGINTVTLGKQDNYLDLSNPEDYIRYKILLANKDFIAPSLQDLQNVPKATYQFVIISEGEETKVAKSNMSTTMKCYKEFGKIEDDFDKLKLVIETISNKPISNNTKLEFLQTKANEFIQSNSKLFLDIITDPLLSTKVLIKKCVESGIISNRGNFLYLRSDNTPLCENGEEPTLSTAARYLNNPKHQEILFTLQAKINM